MPESKTKVLVCISNKTQDLKFLYSQKYKEFQIKKFFDSKCIEEIKNKKGFTPLVW